MKEQLEKLRFKKKYSLSLNLANIMSAYRIVMSSEKLE